MSDMVIVVIHWKIKPGRENDFLKHWSRVLEIKNRSKLVGEFLSIPMKSKPAKCKTTVLGRSPSSSYISYFNVGMWEKHDSFYQEVIKPYVKKAPKKRLPFEAKDRERMVLKPELWRIRCGELPASDQLI